MSSTPLLPESILSRVPQGHRQSIEIHRQRANQLNEKTSKFRSVSDFLEGRIKALNSDIDYITQLHQGLEAARENSQISAHEFREALGPFLPPTQLIVNESRTVIRQRKLITEDLEEDLATKKQRIEGPGMGIYLKAYTSSIMERVMTASGKKRGKAFDTRKFKAAVNEYYGVKKGTAHCHLFGQIDPVSQVKAAHIVPKSLTQPEIAYLFGCEAMVESDPRNAVNLHMKIELGLDTGAIVIVPIIEQSNTASSSPSRWKCVLIDESRRNDTLCRIGDDVRLWNEIDGKELIFLNENRPARRYLYFRFVITYILWKREGLNSRFTSKVEALKDFWPTPGPYLRKSMLSALARNISGSNLPDTLITDRTFTDDEYPQPGNSMSDGSVVSDLSTRTASIVVAHEIQNALLTTLQRACISSESASSQMNGDDEDEIVFDDCLEHF